MYKTKKMSNEELMDFIEEAKKDPNFIKAIKKFIKLTSQ